MIALEELLGKFLIDPLCILLTFCLIGRENVEEKL